jgi:hypothetical protein
MNTNYVASQVNNFFHTSVNGLCFENHVRTTHKHTLQAKRSDTERCKGEQIPVARSPWPLNFVRWPLIFVGPHYGTCLLSPFGIYYFEVAPRLWKICVPLH